MHTPWRQSALKGVALAVGGLRWGDQRTSPSASASTPLPVAQQRAAEPLRHAAAGCAVHAAAAAAAATAARAPLLRLPGRRPTAAESERCSLDANLLLCNILYRRRLRCSSIGHELEASWINFRPFRALYGAHCQSQQLEKLLTTCSIQHGCKTPVVSCATTAARPRTACLDAQPVRPTRPAILIAAGKGAMCSRPRCCSVRITQGTVYGCAPMPARVRRSTRPRRRGVPTEVRAAPGQAPRANPDHRTLSRPQPPPPPPP